jgi:hypothetical protein
VAKSRFPRAHIFVYTSYVKKEGLEGWLEARLRTIVYTYETQDYYEVGAADGAA